MSIDLKDPVGLAQALIRCPSVTPEDAGALAVLEAALTRLGFACRRLRFSEPGTPDIDNLYARRGKAGRHFCFAGHTDVVPVGDRAGWSVDPFGAEIVDGVLFGRGAADMKGAIACFVAAVARYLEQGGEGDSISLLITGDEEGPSINGTAKVLGWMADQGELPDGCLVGEPTNPARLGQVAKIGRRGSFNGRLTVFGAQGHVAYPHLCDNPMPRLLRLLATLTEPLDARPNQWFQPSRLEITTIDTGNPATNIIPARVVAGFNVRFNDEHSGASLERLLRDRLEAVEEGSWQLDVQITGESFRAEPDGRLMVAISDAVEEVCGESPVFNTDGGTSDARFIHRVCPVAEFGLTSQTMHKVDERVSLADLEALTVIYQGVLTRFLAAP